MFRNACCLLNHTHRRAGELLLCPLGLAEAHPSTCYSDGQAGLHTEQQHRLQVPVPSSPSAIARLGIHLLT